MTALLLLARYWRYLAIGVPILALTIALGISQVRGNRWQKRAGEYRAQLDMQRTQALEATVAAQKRVKDAEAAYDARAAALQPVIIRSTDTVTRYAQTPAGRSSCLSADRMRGIDALDAEIRASPAPASGSGTVPANASASPSGR